MTDYTGEDWARLGRAVKRARLKKGFVDTGKWAEAAKRSTRMVLGLERGEQVGPSTLIWVESALDWPSGWSYKILQNAVEGEPELEHRDRLTADEAIELAERRRGSVQPSSEDRRHVARTTGEDVKVRDATLEQLLEEVARRARGESP